MEGLAFTQYGFQLYNNEDAEALIRKSRFVQIKLTQKEEWIPGKTGEYPVKKKLYNINLKK